VLQSFGVCPTTQNKNMVNTKKAKKRTYEDWVELGRLLTVAREAIVSAVVKSSKMFPLIDGETKKILSIEKKLSHIKSILDDRYCLEYEHEDIETFPIKFPMYPLGEDE
jgi:hypothetical protein